MNIAWLEIKSFVWVAQALSRLLEHWLIQCWICWSWCKHISSHIRWRSEWLYLGYDGVNLHYDHRHIISSKTNWCLLSWRILCRSQWDTNNFQLSTFNQGLVWGPDTQTFTADDTGGNNWLILTSTANYQTGVQFEVSNSGGALPMPLLTGTTYYAIRVDATHIRVATAMLML